MPSPTGDWIRVHRAEPIDVSQRLLPDAVADVLRSCGEHERAQRLLTPFIKRRDIGNHPRARRATYRVAKEIVSFESRYGTCDFSPLSAMITPARAESERLILPPAAARPSPLALPHCPRAWFGAAAVLLPTSYRSSRPLIDAERVNPAPAAAAAEDESIVILERRRFEKRGRAPRRWRSRLRQRSKREGERPRLPTGDGSSSSEGLPCSAKSPAAALPRRMIDNPGQVCRFARSGQVHE